jgi:hypothetical protein
MGHSGYGRIEGYREEFSAGAASDEVAHARARFAVDPATPTRLADAWSAPTGATEEDESEFVDAVADCLSVGLPLDAAVASWRAGTNTRRTTSRTRRPAFSPPVKRARGAGSSGVRRQRPLVRFRPDENVRVFMRSM